MVVRIFWLEHVAYQKVNVVKPYLLIFKVHACSLRSNSADRIEIVLPVIWGHFGRT